MGSKGLEILAKQREVARDTDTATEYLRGLGYRVNFATLDSYGFPYYHLWEGNTPLLMSSDVIRQRAMIEVAKRIGG